MASSALATAFVNIVPGTKAVEDYLKGDLGKNAGDAGTKAGNAFSNGFSGSLKKLATAGALLAITKQVSDFVGASINAGNALFIEFEGVNSVFGKSAKTVQAFAKTAAQTAGISETAALAAAKGFGGFASSAGLASESAANFAIGLTSAAGDMASFYGGGTQAALDAIKSGLLGQYEPLLKYNQQITEAKVKTEAFAMGLTKSTSAALDPNTRALAVQSLVMKGLGVAQGDFVKYADSFDNAQQTMTANFQNMQATLGQSLLPVLGQLVAAINPVIEMAGPLLFNVFQKLIPLFELVTGTISKLMPALDPIVKIFGVIVDVVVAVLDAALTPLIDILNALLPVVTPIITVFGKLITSILKPFGMQLQNTLVPIIQVLATILEITLVPILEMFGAILGAVFEAFVPVQQVINGLVKKYLPQFTNFLKQYILPMMQQFTAMILNWVVPAISQFAQWLAEAAKTAIPAMIQGFKNLMKFLQPVWDFLKPVVSALMSMMGMKPIKLSVSTSVDKTTADMFGGKTPSGIDYSGISTGGGVDQAAAKKAAAAAKKAKEKAIKDRKAIKKILADTNEEIFKVQTTYDEAVANANAKFAESKTKILAAYDEKVADLTKKRNADIAKSDLEHNAKVLQIQADFNKKLADIVQQSKDRLRQAFESVTAVDVGKTFADLGIKSVDNVIIKLQRGLKKAKDLVANSAALANAGFSQTFIEQIVAQGPDTGNAFAQALLKATPESQAQLQALFAETQQTSAHGMDALTNSLYEKTGLATEALNTLYAQTQADLTAMLDAESLRYNEEQTNILATFNEGVAEAAKTRDEALAEANKTLTEALAEATKNLTDSMDEIQKNLTEKLSAYKSQLKSYAAEIAAIQAQIAASKAAAAADAAVVIDSGSNPYVSSPGLAAALEAAGLPVGSAVTRLTRMATGGYVTSATPALVGEAGPEVITPLKEFERMMGMSDGNNGPSITYIAAPNQSLDAEQALFQAIKRAKVVGAW
jgi:hypothetical protein